MHVYDACVCMWRELLSVCQGPTLHGVSEGVNWSCIAISGTSHTWQLEFRARAPELNRHPFWHANCLSACGSISSYDQTLTCSLLAGSAHQLIFFCSWGKEGGRGRAFRTYP